MGELAQALGLENKIVGSAFGALSKFGLLAMDAAKRVSLGAAAELLANGIPKTGEAATRMTVLRGLLDRAARPRRHPGRR
jgi:phenylalanyl-tRNA synthetase alpha chain